MTPSPTPTPPHSSLLSLSLFLLLLLSQTLTSSSASASASVPTQSKYNIDILHPPPNYVSPSPQFHLISRFDASQIDTNASLCYTITKYHNHYAKQALQTSCWEWGGWHGDFSSSTEMKTPRKPRYPPGHGGYFHSIVTVDESVSEYGSGEYSVSFSVWSENSELLHSSEPTPFSVSPRMGVREGLGMREGFGKTLLVDTFTYLPNGTPILYLR